MHRADNRLTAFNSDSLACRLCCRRYGLIGPNGCGKSCLLKALAAREVAIPHHIDIYYLDREVTASNETALECVKSVDDERIRLEKESEALMEQGELPAEAEQRLEDIYERCGSVCVPFNGHTAVANIAVAASSCCGHASDVRAALIVTVTHV